jgi:hypothetical protein
MNQTILFAKQELEKYMLLLAGEKGNITLLCETEEPQDIIEEYFEINILNGKGCIIGNQPRSVLLGVYHFLKECGISFIRPGKKGEIIPKKELIDLSLNIKYTPSNRHRGITIEGAVSVENVKDLIDWAAKSGFNSYFIQFRNAYEFFERWYKHKGNDILKEENFDIQKSDKYVQEIVEEIKKRSMIYHAVGHGWTCECLGVKSLGWHEFDIKLSEDNTNLLAMVNGKRGFYKNKPLNTHLCYSNPIAREKLVTEVVEYLQKHNEIDLLHFWLADDYNNICECEECKKHNISDLYILILNEIDKKLSELNIKTKICFAVYLELYWAPKKEKIKNESRFILMFAPIFRKYTEPFTICDFVENDKKLNFELNKMLYPTDSDYYLNFLRDWQKAFKGDSFDFDYHLMWDINRDFSGLTLSKVLYSDIITLNKIGLNGFISCQVQRAFYPNGLCMYLMGSILYNSKKSYYDIEKEYYLNAFGELSEKAKLIFEDVSKYISFKYFKDENTLQDNSVSSSFKIAIYLLNKHLYDLKDVKLNNISQNESLELLRFLLKFSIQLSEIIIAKEDESTKLTAENLRMKMKKWVDNNELRFQPYFDGFYINMIIDGLIKKQETKIYAE